jgi:hypothetical protein
VLELKPNLDPERNLWSSFELFEKINAFKRHLQLNPIKNKSSKKRIERAESILSIEINEVS